MTIEFKLPELGENIDSGDVTDVMVREGDEIAAEQEVIEIETEKAMMPVPCPHAGRVVKVHVKKGDTIPVGATLLTLEQVAASVAGEAAADAGPSTRTAPEAEISADAVAEEVTTAEEEVTESPRAEVPQAAAAPPDSELPATVPLAAPASPDTRRFARELGVDIRSVSGSGPGGRITKEDVRNAVRASLADSPAAKAEPETAGARPDLKLAPSTEEQSGHDGHGPIRRAPLSRMRRTIAQNMANSAAVIPHVTNFDDADITELERIRKGSMADYVGDVKLTMMSFVLKAAAMALKHHQEVNSSLDLENGEVVYKDYVNIGVAVDTPRGLVVPVMRDVDKLSIPQIAKTLAQTAADAREAKFKIEDLRGGSFTISNLGAVGGQYSTPIINHPEVAILLVGRSRKLPVVVEESVQIRLMMPLSVSYDHRLIDGATAARFLNDVIGYLEVPGRLLLAP